MKTIFLTIVALSISAWADFAKTGNIVTDNITGLQWQDDTVGTSMTWQVAIDHCETLTLDGFNDWRLPNLKELTSLRDYNASNPAIDVTFQNTDSSFYWSSTSDASTLDYAWQMNFYSGNQSIRIKSDSRYVRCVRAGH